MDSGSGNFLAKGPLLLHHVAGAMPRQLKTLDDLLAQAEQYANYCLRRTGHSGALSDRWQAVRLLAAWPWYASRFWRVAYECVVNAAVIES